MKKQKTVNVKITGLIGAMIVSLVFSVLTVLVLAVLMYRFSFSKDKLYIGVMIGYLISTMAGGFLAGKKICERKFLWGFLAGVMYYLVLVLISLVCGEGNLQDGQQIALACLVCVTGGTLGGMFS